MSRRNIVEANKLCLIIKDSVCGVGIVEDQISDDRFRVRMLYGYTVNDKGISAILKQERISDEIDQALIQSIIDDFGGYSYEDDYADEVERRESEAQSKKASLIDLEEDDFYFFASKDDLDLIPDEWSDDVLSGNYPRLIWNHKLPKEEKKSMMFEGSALLLDPKEYDQAIICFKDDIVYYDYESVIEATYRIMPSCDPYDHVSYNILGSLADKSINIRILAELECEPDPDDDIEVIEINNIEYEVIS